MERCIWGAPLGDCSPREGIAPHMSKDRRWVLGSASCAAPALSAEPCALLLLPLFCGHISLLERGDRRGAAGRGEGVGTAPSADSHLVPLAPTRPTGTCRGRGAAVRDEGGPSGWTPKFLGPMTRWGKFFLLYLACFNLKGEFKSGGTSIPGPPGSRPSTAPLPPGCGVSPHPRSCPLSPFSLWRGLMDGHYGGPPS